MVKLVSHTHYGATEYAFRAPWKNVCVALKRFLVQSKSQPVSWLEFIATWKSTGLAIKASLGQSLFRVCRFLQYWISWSKCPFICLINEELNFGIPITHQKHTFQ